MKYPIPISVVMPCFNYGKYVSDSIGSIIHQSFEDFEFIIINDGSTDNSHLEIVRHSDKRIRYVSLSENKGNFPARNLGMRMARGKYICVMDADDISHADRLKIQFDYLESNNRIGAIGTQGKWMKEDGSQTGKVFNRPICSWKHLQTFLLLDSQSIHPSLMFRRYLLNKHDLYYNEQYRCASDYDFLIRCASLFPVYNIKEALLYYRAHPGQISRSRRMQQIDFADRIRITQLKKLLKNPSTSEIEIYLKLMKGIGFSDRAEFESCVLLMEQLLAFNQHFKLYNKVLLYNLFDYLLSEAKINVITSHQVLKSDILESTLIS